MTDCFDVVPIWPRDKSAVVVGVVLRAQPRRSVVFASGGKRSSVELPNLLAALGCERNVYRARTATDRPEPLSAFAGAAYQGPAFTFPGDSDAERLKGFDEEVLGLREIRDIESNVIKDHEKTSDGRVRAEKTSALWKD